MPSTFQLKSSIFVKFSLSVINHTLPLMFWNFGHLWMANLEHPRKIKGCKSICVSKLEAPIKSQRLQVYLKWKFLALLACYDDD